MFQTTRIKIHQVPKQLSGKNVDPGLHPGRLPASRRRAEENIHQRPGWRGKPSTLIPKVSENMPGRAMCSSTLAH